MLVRNTSEFALIELMALAFEARGAPGPHGQERLGYLLLKGIGDDAAVWDGPAGPMVAATDTMVEGVHFRLDTTTWDNLGWKAMAVNLSDIAAMGCEPLYALVTVGLRGDIPVAGLESMCSGMAEAGREYGCAVVGGDTVSSPVLFATVAVTGAPPEGGDSPLLSRSAAVPGDVIAVTGSLGCSAGGLRMRQQGLRLPADVSAHLSEAHDRPVPRVPEASRARPRRRARGHRRERRPRGRPGQAMPRQRRRGRAASRARPHRRLSARRRTSTAPSRWPFRAAKTTSCYSLRPRTWSRGRNGR